MLLQTVAIILLVLLAVGALPIGGNGPYYGTGWWGGGTIGLLALILLLILIFRGHHG